MDKNYRTGTSKNMQENYNFDKKILSFNLFGLEKFKCKVVQI